MKRSLLLFAVVLSCLISCEKPDYYERKICNEVPGSRERVMPWLTDCVRASNLANYTASDEEEHDAGAIVRECGIQAEKLVVKVCESHLLVILDHKDYDCTDTKYLPAIEACAQAGLDQRR